MSETADNALETPQQTIRYQAFSRAGAAHTSGHTSQPDPLRYGTYRSAEPLRRNDSNRSEADTNEQSITGELWRADRVDRQRITRSPPVSGRSILRAIIGGPIWAEVEW